MAKRSLKIAHLFPELLNLYGDSGNIITLARRLEWRGLACTIQEVAFDDTPSFADVDLVFIGGGSDREQEIVARKLQAHKRDLQAFVEDGGCLLAVCGGYQLLGHYYQLGEEKGKGGEKAGDGREEKAEGHGEKVEGLSLVDLYTDRGDPRLIGNIIVESDLTPTPVVGYENHGGRTHLGSGVEPFGRVVYGFGNDGTSGFEGVRYKNVLGTYIHGPLLPKNPGIADWALAAALERKYGLASKIDDEMGNDALPLEPLDDSVELLANEVMRERLLSGKVKER